MGASRDTPNAKSSFSPFASLRFREYRLLWLSQVGASSAMWTEQVARNWLTYEITGSALQLGLVNLMQAIPIVALGLWGGVLTDRFDKRKLLLAIQAYSMIVYSVMGAIILTGNLELWHLYASSFAVAAGMAMDGPLRTSTIPSIVPQERLINALSLNGIAINGTRLLLPAGVGVMLGISSPGWAYVALAVVYVANQVISSRLRLPDERQQAKGASGAPTQQKSMLADLGEGLTFARRNGDILAVLVVAIGLQGVGFASRSLMPVFAAEKLSGASGTYGVLLSADGLGAVLGGLVIASVGFPARKGLLLLIVAGTNALAILLMGWSAWLVVAFILSMSIGGSSTAFRSSSNSLLLGGTPPHLRGRIMSINGLNPGIAAMTTVVVGAIADATNISIALSAIGGMGLLMTALVVLWRPRIATHRG
jgi:MFS family permease